MSAEGDDGFPGLGSCGNEILTLSLVPVHPADTQPGEATALPGSRHHTRVSPSLPSAGRGLKAHLLLRCHHLEAGDNLPQDAGRKNEGRHGTASILPLNYVARQLVPRRTLTYSRYQRIDLGIEQVRALGWPPQSVYLGEPSEETYPTPSPAWILHPLGLPEVGRCVW